MTLFKLAVALKRVLIALALWSSSFNVLANALAFESLIQASLSLDYELSQIHDTMSSSVKRQIPIVVDASALQKVQAVTALRVHNSIDGLLAWEAPVDELRRLLSIPFFDAIPVPHALQHGRFTVTVEWLDRNGKPKRDQYPWVYSASGHQGVVFRLSSPQRGRVSFISLPVERTKDRLDTRSPLTVWESLILNRIRGLVDAKLPLKAYTEFRAATAEMPRLTRLIPVQVTQAQLLTSLRLENQAATVLSRGLFSTEQTASLRENRVWLRLAQLNLEQQQLGMAARRLAKMRLPDADSLAGKSTVEVEQWHALIEQADVLRQDVALRQGATATIKSHAQDIHWAINQFNLAALHARKERLKEAEAAFQVLTSLPLSHVLFQDQRFVALYEKAWLNLGYVYLANEQYSKAEQSFQQLRLASPFAVEGAMGAGWAANKQEQYQPSLTPWRWLLEQAPVYPYQPAALLGVADVYERKSQFEHAMAAYQSADQQYTAMITSVTDWLALIKQVPEEWLAVTRETDSVLTGSVRCDVASIDMAAWVSNAVVNRRFQTLCARRQYVIERQQMLKQRIAQLQTTNESLDATQRLMFEGPIAMLQQQVQLLMVELKHAQMTAESQMQSQLAKSLFASKEKVSHYQLAARLASARLSDIQSGGQP